MASLKQSFSVDSGSFSEKDKEIADRLQKLKRDRIKGMLLHASTSVIFSLIVLVTFFAGVKSIDKRKRVLF